MAYNKMNEETVKWMELALKVAGGIEEKQKEEVAYKRVLYALGDQVGLKPEDVDRAVSMAKAGIEEDLKFKETAPGSGLYMGNTIQNLAAEPREVAAKKGKQYIEQVLEHMEE